MRNKNPPPRRCWLSTFWKNSQAEDTAYYELAHRAMDAMVKGGMTEEEARSHVQLLWSGGYENGAWEEAYNLNENS